MQSLYTCQSTARTKTEQVITPHTSAPGTLLPGCDGYLPSLPLYDPWYVCRDRPSGELGSFEQKVLRVQFECHYTIHSPLWLSLLVSSGWSALKPCGLVDRALCFGRGSRWPVRGRSHKWGSNWVPSRSPGEESGACSGISSSPSPTTCNDKDA